MVSACMIMTTTDSEAHATQLAKIALELKLAACVQIIPGVRSLYLWKDKIQDTREFLIYFKTDSRRADELMSKIKGEHKYETPEIISVSIDSIDQEYHKWLTASLS